MCVLSTNVAVYAVPLNTIAAPDAKLEPKASKVKLPVLITRWPDEQFRGATRLFAHEARHATQYAWCGGLLMLPLYGGAALVSWALTGDFGARNVFEQQAGLADGGYSPRELRPPWRRARSGYASA